MIAVDEAALQCDFMETYHVPNYRALPARQAALFACGLRSDSRIRMKLAGAKVRSETLLLALIADAARMCAWLQSTDGVTGKNRPQSIAAKLLPEGESETAGFDSPEAFDAWRASMIGE